MPFAPLVCCSYPGCRRLVVRGRCDAHKAQQRRAGAAADKRFYDSALWKRVRDQKLKRDPLCQYCAHLHRLTTARQVDHYVPLEAGGHPTDEHNLVSTCTSCHSRKTRGDEQGLPPPPYAPSTPVEHTFA